MISAQVSPPGVVVYPVDSPVDKCNDSARFNFFFCLQLGDGRDFPCALLFDGTGCLACYGARKKILFARVNRIDPLKVFGICEYVF